MYVVKVYYDNKKRANDPSSLTPESRLWLLLFLAPLEPIGLFIFGWTSKGPKLPWIAPMIGTVLIAAANLAIYQGSKSDTKELQMLGGTYLTLTASFSSQLSIIWWLHMAPIPLRRLEATLSVVMCWLVYVSA